ncbi:ABC transporter ATP-binding protein [Anaeromicropila populeti]|uniref:Putative ABC transport system ATP-binding protein n=1 Tax=Anaeromicropila populeti TaxID=37658 RepID=A0A1I6LJF2_9FIRM|nr:ABC transporter ATP-binding protein [Anaeromicropila populeti]SFS03615.1 putative ABC transport system ATP-binding protein [Anaeromicropila populeti]
MDDFLIEMEGIEKYYGKKENPIHAIRGSNLKICKGSMIAIQGVSGSGKSTLLNILGLLDRKSAGKYKLFGIDVEQLNEKKKAEMRNSKIGFVLQEFALIEKLTVMENIRIPFSYSKKHMKWRLQNKIARDILVKLGIEDKEKELAANLSGGQRQRVAIARAIVNDPELILADEPTGALDTITSMEIMSIFKALNQSGKTIIIVTHDNEVAQFCSKIYKMVDGKLEVCN